MFKEGDIVEVIEDVHHRNGVIKAGTIGRLFKKEIVFGLTWLMFPTMASDTGGIAIKDCHSDGAKIKLFGKGFSKSKFL